VFDVAVSEKLPGPPDERRWWEMQLGVELLDAVASAKHRNDLAKRKVARDLSNRGYPVSIPSVDDCRYDLVVEVAGRLERVQIRHAGCDVAVAAEVDWLAVYDPTTDRCSYTRLANDLMEPAGLEPATSWMQTRRSPN
jgi:hypothetical protein